MHNNNNKFSYSWPIIMLLVLFWPIGIYVFVKKVSSDKDNVYSEYNRIIRNKSNNYSNNLKEEITAKNKFDLSSSKLKYIGIVLVIVAFIGLIGGLSNDGGIITPIFGIIGGILLVNKSKKLKKEVDIVKHYFSIIIDGNIRQLDKIAYTTGKSYDTVYKDIKYLIDKDYLENAYIDESRREIIFTYTHNSSKENEAKVITCKCCGATNTIYGTGECEYCGSPLN